MAQNIMIIPATTAAGARTVAFGLSDILLNKNIRATVLPGFDLGQLEQLLSTNRTDDLLENIVEQQETAALNHDVIIVSGIALHRPYAAELNFAIATALDAAIIFVATPDNDLPDTLRQLAIISNPYRFRYEHKILGYILNKYNDSSSSVAMNLPYLGAIPFRCELSEPIGSYHAGVTAGVIAKHLDVNWLWPFLNSGATTKISAPMFRQRLLQSAKQLNRKIVLPEGDEPRTLQAANICAERGIAQCILLGQKAAIQQAAAKINLQLHERITIIDPADILEKYVAPLVEIRRSKGLTTAEARQQLADNVMLGTMMLQLGDVDGLVSGAVHTTANTIRPALQVIKTVPESKIVSSVFFMCLPDQVLVYGDCAINPNPSPEELANIAIQSADSAAAFGITPRVAMLSYSTGASGTGADVDKIKIATELAKKQRPDLALEGPLQYDAAAVKEVGMLKAPHSLVAGRATVFIMPNLDVGNIAYKAVQRTTGIVCIGPMLQGLRKPVNDLSRGCLVEDIVYTIAVTAVQSKNS